jgi:hypothetical protein
MADPMRCGDKHSFGPGRRAVKRLNEPTAEEPQAPSAVAIAVGPSILTLRDLLHTRATSALANCQRRKFGALFKR